MVEPPPLVISALARAEAESFPLSSEEVAGRLLGTLGAAVPVGGRILEIGTGCGVGTAWIVAGLADRKDVEVVSVEIKPEVQAIAREHAWPPYVQLRLGSIFELYAELGSFDLIFADSGAGKWDGRDRTVAALKPGGLLLMDDMKPPKWTFPNHEALNAEVRRDLLNHPELVGTELAAGTGMIVCVKKRHPEKPRRSTGQEQADTLQP